MSPASTSIASAIALAEGASNAATSRLVTPVAASLPTVTNERV